MFASFESNKKRKLKSVGEGVPRKIKKKSKLKDDGTNTDNRNNNVDGASPGKGSFSFLNAAAPHASDEEEVKLQRKDEQFQPANDTDDENENAIDRPKKVDHFEEEDDLEKQLTGKPEFKISDFRKKLKGENFIPDIRHFIALAAKKNKIVKKYIEKRGKPLEIAEALERIDKSNLSHAFYVSLALNYVLMEILTNEKEQMEHAQVACRYFLRGHAYILEKLIHSDVLNHRIGALKLMTSIVCSEPQLGRQVLFVFDTIQGAKEARQKLNNRKSSKENKKDSVRKCFVHFMLAYLVDGNILLIRNILDKHELIGLLIGGLTGDDHITICVVLNTIKKYVLENLYVSKTKKVQLFDIYLHDLMKLMYWQGAEDISEEKDSCLEERETVAKTVHEFLICLLTSRKYGTAFDSMNNLKIKHNRLPHKALKLLHSPWKNDLEMDLCVKIIEACPELAKGCIKSCALSKAFRFLDNEDEGVTILSFVERIVSTLNPTIMKSGLWKITLTDYTQWIKDMCLCPELLFGLRNRKFMQHNSFAIRVSVARLLLTMFRQYCNYMTVIINREKLNGNDLKKFRFDMINYLLVNFPSVEFILLSLFDTINQQEKPGVDVLEHLDYTLDLILLIRKANPSFVDRTGVVIDYIKMLKPFYESSSDNPQNVKIELKVIKVIQQLQPGSLASTSHMFSEILGSVFNSFLCASNETQQEAAGLLKTILLRTNLFENGSLEVDLWLEVLKHMDKNVVDEIKSHLVKKFSALPEKKEKLESVQSAEDNIIYHKSKLEELFDNIDKGMAVEGYTETITLNKFLPHLTLSCGEGAPYYELLLFLMFHYTPNANAVYALYSKHFNAYYKYMFNWIGKEKPGKLKCRSIPYFNEMYDSIINGRTNFTEVFQAESEEKSRVFSIDGKEVQLTEHLANERMVMIYIYQITFITSRLTMNQNFESSVSSSALHFLINLLQILSLSETEEETTHELLSTEENKQTSYLKQALKYFYCSQIRILQNFNLFGNNISEQNYLSFISNLTDVCGKFNINSFEDITAHYRSKIVNQIVGVIPKLGKGEAVSGCRVDTILKCIEVFKMTSENCNEILRSFTKIKFENCDMNEESRLLFLEMLVCILNRLCELKTSKIDGKLASKLGNLYVRLIKNSANDANLDKLEDAFVNFLSVFHYCIPSLPIDAFLMIFYDRKTSKSSVRFAATLLERRDDLNEKFIEMIPECLDKKEIIYPLLNVACRKGIEFEAQLRMKIYQEFKNGFMKCVEKPQKAGVIYKENVEISMYLIEQCMPASECIDFTKKSLKFDSVETYQVQIIETIYKKALASYYEDKDICKTIFANFLNCLMQLFACVQKKDLYNSTKLETLCFCAFKWIEGAKGLNIEKSHFEFIVTTSLWNTFCKNCLKFSMQAIELEDEAEKNKIAKYNALLAKILAYLTDFFYENDSEDENIAQLFDMVITHSRFFDIALVQDKCDIKAEIMHLYFVLINKNKTVLDKKHIPLLLGAYQAKLSKSDQYILATLMYYEQQGIDLTEFRPFIWGESAIAHYSLRNEEEKYTLAQEPSISMLMSLVDRRISEYTMKNYPIWRFLNVFKQLPEIEFDDPNTTKLVYANNKLEKLIESGVEEFESHFLNHCPKRFDLYDECYDPAFIVPLMSMAFAPEVLSHPFRPVENGLLGVVFSALSSVDKEMRLAAGCVQVRYRTHFENNKFLDQPLWIQAYDNIQSGLDQLRKTWLDHKKSGVPRPPYIPCLFLAKTFTQLDPTNPIYKVSNMYLRVKETFSFTCVPEFNLLFYSSEVDHQLFRRFILEVMKDGIKCSSDFFLLLTTGTLRIVMSYYKSSTSTLEENLLILSLMSTCAKIPNTSKCLIEQAGIIVWLDMVISNIEYYQFDTIEGVISVINNLWYAARARNTEFINFNQIETRIFYLLVKLSDHISSRISFSGYSKLINILTKTAGRNHKSLPESSLDHLISCSHRHFEDHIWYIQNIKANGANCIESSESFCKSLKNVGLSQDCIFTLVSLREFVINWVS